jgi:hypothetical protein
VTIFTESLCSPREDASTCSSVAMADAPDQLTDSSREGHGVEVDTDQQRLGHLLQGVVAGVNAPAHRH